MKNLQQWIVYRVSPNGKYRLPLNHFDTEQQARAFCDHIEWVYVDENQFYWDIEYEQARGAA